MLTHLSRKPQCSSNLNTNLNKKGDHKVMCGTAAKYIYGRSNRYATFLYNLLIWIQISIQFGLANKQTADCVDGSYYECRYEIILRA